ncbi:cupin domain-containing protein [Halonotius sp. GCM10025705]|uniref:cupin domain-containing protein n=1 Tax=Halonotius sp. GCM10025705 TaxID=3252678 RepID=UPI003608570D
MTATSIDAERDYDDKRFSAVELCRTDRQKTVCGYFEPGQFIPVHAPDSDVVITVLSGSGLVREGDTDHGVEPGSVVAVEADTDRGIKADDDSRLEAVLVTAPPPTDGEHDPVRRGLKHDAFEPPETEQ